MTEIMYRVFIYAGNELGATVNGRYKRHWIGAGEGASTGISESYYDLYQDPHEKNPQLVPLIHTQGQFNRMVARMLVIGGISGFFSQSASKCFPGNNVLIFRSPSIICLSFALVVSACSRETAVPEGDRSPNARPNILLIVADDMGYSDVGIFGSEIATPNIDALAAEGMMLTQFHVSPNCGPTRGAMMTGVDPHRAGMGGNHEVAAANQKGQPGYEGYLRKDVVTIAELLRDAGYHTYMTGKWHLGADSNNPASRGFEKSFALLNGAASHWADQGAIIPGATTRYVSDGQIVDELPEDFYSTTWYTDQLISYIDSGSDDGAPFFAYLSFTAPHNPLHVPQEYIDKYRGRFNQGWDVLAVERFARLRALGLVEDSQDPQPRPEWVMAWDELSPEQKAARARDMEIYAGMIDYVDESIGRLLEHLRQSGNYDNTLIVFLSDNGPSRTSIQGYPDVYNGESVVPLQGTSLMPLLNGESPIEVESRELGWSAYGMDAYRRGHWKVLRLPKPYGNGDWQLYDLIADPGEVHDLASEFPERARALAKAWEDYAESNGVIQPDAATAYAKPVVGRKY